MILTFDIKEYSFSTGKRIMVKKWSRPCYATVLNLLRINVMSASYIFFFIIFISLTEHIKLKNKGEPRFIVQDAEKKTRLKVHDFVIHVEVLLKGYPRKKIHHLPLMISP